MIVVQVVRIVWTKASRGAPHATARNALPRAFPLAGNPGPYVLERHRLVETAPGTFTASEVERATSLTVPRREAELLIDAREDRLRLGLQWRSGMLGTGQPRRPDRRRAIELRPGQTARLVVNGRHASSAGQWYTQDTFNVALVNELAPGLFTDAPPLAVVRLEADLL